MISLSPSQGTSAPWGIVANNPLFKEKALAPSCRSTFDSRRL